ncbi:MAG: hypothetical protein UR56_C0007G0041 [Candidatus Roizmanbacteria bacterium GW2011_GWC2_34_23]|uniref:Uncharacterized protein n=1 Tax=Candidatus Roizmanbacteria bacterium GW2011_GWC2_34_23 TaxID=1618484 RepID=A0A0G0AXW7_9BACT|nr:MAG: hypothetical protein UR56_C0007G0041 [Candidatus Roizmanbacteria bacterium GW2011_GWC2_34_23]
MTILIFTEGTVLMPGSAKGKIREEIVQQSKKFRILIDDPDGIHNYQSYIPVYNAVEKIKKWKKQGATIFYLSSRRVKSEIEAIGNVLQKYGFPDSQNLLYRQQGEDYKDVAEKLMPDILIEDDCESIGGKQKMTYTHMSRDAKAKVHSITVKEFSGIDHLPDNLGQLKTH